jgi:TM2 domain-containing membrane protein YozV
MKKKSTALLLSIFLGELGFDRFYLGKAGTGILKLITAGGCGIWWLVDIILIATGKMTDKSGNPLQ